MEFLRDTNYDFMKYRKFWVWVSLLLVAFGIFSIFVHGQLNIGIDFAGGTQITLKFRQRPDVDRLRTVLATTGLGEVQVQSFGEEAENAVILRTPILQGTEEGSRERVVAALTREFSPDAAGKPDFNAIGVERLTQLLATRNPDGVPAGTARAHYAGVARRIIEARREARPLRLLGGGGARPRRLAARRRGAAGGRGARRVRGPRESRTSGRRSARSCARRGSWRSSCRCSACWSTSGSASSSASGSGR